MENFPRQVNSLTPQHSTVMFAFSKNRRLLASEGQGSRPVDEKVHHRRMMQETRPLNTELSAASAWKAAMPEMRVHSVGNDEWR